MSGAKRRALFGFWLRHPLMVLGHYLWRKPRMTHNGGQP